ncbi:hypothetical protein GGS26DRAFT_215635 [Hypomontagnella submonticulosa]|nr:hypothetical protein GGS26DRAFT_215635 [Hypomontagnella submonticulosa]
MPITEAALLLSNISGEVPPALRDLGVAAIAIQGEWCRINAPWLTEDRGTALFQELENPGIILITAHWDSIEQHHACIASPENQKIIVDLVPHLDAAAVKPRHIDRLHVFPASESEEGLIPALKAPILSVTIWAVWSKNKTVFEQALAQVKGGLDAATMPYRHRGGWMIEKDEDKPNVEHFVMVGGLESSDQNAALAKTKALGEHYQALSSLTLEVETKHYKRIA